MRTISLSRLRNDPPHHKGTYRQLIETRTLTTGIDRLRRIPGSLGDVGVKRVVDRDLARRALNADVGDGQVVRGCLGRHFTCDEAAPSLMAFVDDLRRVFLILGFAREGKCVFGLSIGCIERGRVSEHLIRDWVRRISDEWEVAYGFCRS